eukprot:scaffold138784_cov32-Tisochrysis_lutea.AAC.1
MVHFRVLDCATPGHHKRSHVPDAPTSARLHWTWLPNGLMTERGVDHGGHHHDDLEIEIGIGSLSFHGIVHDGCGSFGHRMA